MDGQAVQQTLEGGGIVEHAGREFGDGTQALRLHAGQHAAFERSAGVVAEVEAVVGEDAFEEEIQLDVLHRFVGRRLTHGVKVAEGVGFEQGARVR